MPRVRLEKNVDLPRLRKGPYSVRMLRERYRYDTLLIAALEEISIYFVCADYYRIGVLLRKPLEGGKSKDLLTTVDSVPELVKKVKDFYMKMASFGVNQMMDAMLRMNGYGDFGDNDFCDINDEILSEHCYLDQVWADKEQHHIKPAYQSEEVTHPSWNLVDLFREELAEKYCVVEGEKEFYDSTYNTAEAENEFAFQLDQNASARKNYWTQVPNTDYQEEVVKRFDILAQMFKKDEQGRLENDMTEIDFETFLVLYVYNAIESTEVNESGEYVPQSVNIDTADLLTYGTANSMLAGTTVNGKTTDLECKSTHTAIESMESMLLINQAASGHQPFIPPTSMKAKDERCKGRFYDEEKDAEVDPKKMKLFNPTAGALAKLDYCLTGVGIHQLSNRPDVGAVVGVPNTEGHLDKFLRANLALQESRPYFENNKEDNEELKKLKALAGDYKSFEFSHNPVVLLAKNLSNYAKFSGCLDRTGAPREDIAMICGVNVESEMLIDCRPGGANFCLKLPPRVYASGRPNTLRDNNRMNKSYTLLSLSKLSQEHGTPTPKDVNSCMAALTMGDDTRPLDNPTTRDVYGNISKVAGPAQFEYEEEPGPFFAEIENKRVKNGSPGFCKQYFCMSENGVITFRRDYKNLYKIFKGNTSTHDPEKLSQACHSHLISAYCDKATTAFIREFHEKLQDLLPATERSVRPSESNKPEGMLFKLGAEGLGKNDIRLPLPTDEQITNLMEGLNNPTSKIRVMASYERAMAYGVPLDY